MMRADSGGRATLSRGGNPGGPCAGTTETPHGVLAPHVGGGRRRHSPLRWRRDARLDHHPGAANTGSSNSGRPSIGEPRQGSPALAERPAPSGPAPFLTNGHPPGWSDTGPLPGHQPATHPLRPIAPGDDAAVAATHDHDLQRRGEHPAWVVAGSACRGHVMANASDVRRQRGREHRWDRAKGRHDRALAHRWRAGAASGERRSSRCGSGPPRCDGGRLEVPQGRRQPGETGAARVR